MACFEHVKNPSDKKKKKSQWYLQHKLPLPKTFYYIQIQEKWHTIILYTIYVPKP